MKQNNKNKFEKPKRSPAETVSLSNVKNLVTMLFYSWKKRKTLEQIAEELEDEVETIRPIYDKLASVKK